jgi:ubiquinone/menaquinone biosynthesis C-methylase UbiE
MSVHPVAQVGFASDSSNYDSARPDHQPAAVSKLLNEFAIPPGGRIVEVGSGTGKFTAHLLNRKEKWEIICVEPSDVLPQRKGG